MDVFSIGEMVIDFIPGLEPNSYIRNAGGAPANVAIAVARNGLKSGFCGKIGDDDFGRFLVKTLEENNVQVLCKTPCKQAITTMAFVTLAQNGERSFTFARKPGADMMLTAEEINVTEIENTKILHAGSCSLSKQPASDATVYALKTGHEKGKFVSFDVNYRDLMWDNDQNAATKKILEILPYVDLLKISEEEIGMFGGESQILNLMNNYHLSLVVETLGSKGAKCYFQNKVFEIAGKKAKAVDATGAGDAFWGGFLSSLILQDIYQVQKLTQDNLFYAMKYGNISGWLCVQKKGAISSLPTREEIEKYLENEK